MFLPPETPTIRSGRPSPFTSPTTSARVAPGAGPNAIVSLTTGLAELLIASEKWPCTVTPGIVIATLPESSPARPPVRSTRKPVPPDSVRKFVVPSPKAALAFVTSTRTTSSVPTFAFSSTTSADARWPPTSILTPVACTRRYGPAGRMSDWPPNCSLTARIVVLIAMLNAPVRNGTVTVASSWPARPACVTTKMPCPSVTVTIVPMAK